MGQIESGVELVKAVGEVAKLAKEQGWLDSLWTSLRKKPKVLLLGCTGTGKTSFMNSLESEVVPQAIDLMNRTQTVSRNRRKLSKQPFEFIDVPGQDSHKSERIKAIRTAASEKVGSLGIINVVSYGYHELRGSKPVIENGKVDSGFLETRRKAEIKALREWTSTLCGQGGVAGWVITLITKADLWWSFRDEVIEYYESGAYFDRLGEAQQVHHIVLPYCSVIQMYYGAGETSGRFQDSDRKKAKAHLIETILAETGKKR